MSHFATAFRVSTWSSVCRYKFRFSSQTLLDQQICENNKPRTSLGIQLDIYGPFLITHHAHPSAARQILTMLRLVHLR